VSGPPGIEEACNEIIALRAALKVAQLEARERLADYFGAAELVAAMHKAAWGGEARGPARGVVEDISDLYNTCMFWQRAAEQALRMWERNEDRADGMRDIAYQAACMAERYITCEDGDDVTRDLDQVEAWIEQTEDDSPYEAPHGVH
jgi:hypothetical protein